MKWTPESKGADSNGPLIRRRLQPFIEDTTERLVAAARGSGSWLPPEFVHPPRVELATGQHLRPIRADDVEIDYPAVMASRERLWRKYGEAWGWPPASMTLEQDRADLAHHEREIAAALSFNYAVLDAEESQLLGCVYLDPPEPGEDADAVVSWWVVDERVGSPMERELERFVPEWVTSAWPFRQLAFRPQ